MATGAGLGGQLPVVSGITGTTRAATGGAYSQYVEPVGYFGAATLDNTGAGYAGSVTTGSTMMGPAIQTIWSKEILFQSMPVLRFEQFAVKKTELGTMPGLSVNFMRYNNLPVPAGPLLEGVRMKTHAITANQYAITVAEQGFAVAVSELLLNASFDDIMASSSRLLGRNMALYMDSQARDTLTRSSSVVFGYQKPGAINTGYGIYEPGTPATAISDLVAPATPYYLTPHAVKDAVEVLAAKNIPRLGETYVCFIHPHQSRRLRDTPEWIEVTKYAAPGNFMLGEIGRLDDVVFIETTQITSPSSTVALNTPDAYPSLPGGSHSTANPASYDWRGGALGMSEAQRAALAAGTAAGTIPAGPAHPGLTNYDEATDAFADIDQDPVTAGTQAVVPDVLPQYGRPSPGWGEPWGPYGGTNANIFEAIMLGDNAFGHAISLPVELRDGGVLDFGREHALAWYSIWGWGVVTDSSVVKIMTN